MHKNDDSNITVIEDTAGYMRAAKVTRMIFKSVFVVILSGITLYLIGSKAYVTFGVMSWCLYIILMLLCLLPLRRKTNDSLLFYSKYFNASVIVLVLVYWSIEINVKEYETIMFGKTIQSICNTENRCPSEISGWEKINENHYRNDRMNYYTGSYVEDSNSFILFYHYGPDWDVWIKGGRDKELRVSYGEQ